jgi:hypothetical protein
MTEEGAQSMHLRYILPAPIEIHTKLTKYQQWKYRPMMIICVVI